MKLLRSDANDGDMFVRSTINTNLDLSTMTTYSYPRISANPVSINPVLVIKVKDEMFQSVTQAYSEKEMLVLTPNKSRTHVILVAPRLFRVLFGLEDLV